MRSQGDSALDLRLYLVTDRVPPGSRALTDIVRAAIDGGATLVQLRDKHAETRELVEQARALRAICALSGVPLVVNDRIDVVLAAGADGVHLGQSDMPLVDARRLLGPRAIVGISVRTVEEARDAERDGASYVGANGVWATPTKTDFGEPIGLHGLRALVEGTGLPVVAIGGIQESNAADVAKTGAAGIAVVSAVMKAEEPAEACRRLRRAFGRG